MGKEGNCGRMMKIWKESGRKRRRRMMMRCCLRISRQRGILMFGSEQNDGIVDWKEMRRGI
jgi:hypothetical protein